VSELREQGARLSRDVASLRDELEEVFSDFFLFLREKEARLSRVASLRDELKEVFFHIFFILI